jgi:hypothetical protein
MDNTDPREPMQRSESRELIDQSERAASSSMHRSLQFGRSTTKRNRDSVTSVAGGRPRPVGLGAPWARREREAGVREGPKARGYPGRYTSRLWSMRRTTTSRWLSLTRYRTR